MYQLNVTEEIIRNSFIENLQCEDEDDDIAEYRLTQTLPTYPDFFSLLDGTGTIYIFHLIISIDRVDGQVVKRTEHYDTNQM